MSVLKRLFDPEVPANGVAGPENDPALRILHNDLCATIEALGAHSNALKDFMTSQTALLDTYLNEGGTTNAGATSFDFYATTADLEMVESIVTYIPASVTSAYLVLDDWQIPVPVGALTSTGLKMVVRQPKRTLILNGINGTDKAFVMLNARPAPGAIPGVLH